MAKKMLRSIVAFLNALALLSVIDSIKKIPSFVGDWVSLWQDITIPVWTTIFTFFSIDLSNIFLNYLTVGVIVYASGIRSSYATSKTSNIGKSDKPLFNSKKSKILNSRTEVSNAIDAMLKIRKRTTSILMLFFVFVSAMGVLAMVIVAWPLYLLFFLSEHMRDDSVRWMDGYSENKRRLGIFLETVIYAVILYTGAYALLLL